MQINIDALTTELCALVAALGQDGGHISPSIYDTAQVLRFYPPPEGPEPALDWLVAQQQADGGWGSPEAPYARAVPTLATLLTLHHYRRHNHQIIDAGLEFLQRQAPLWLDPIIDALPIATEMILPCLLEEANALGLAIARDPYRALYQLRQRKCQQISKRTLVAGTPPVYSWEALGQQTQSGLIDHSGGIGHSPSATAAWLQQAVKQPALAAQCQSAITYLQGAAAATGVAIPGVVPNVWPITGFELSYGPYALLTSGLFGVSQLREVLNTQGARLHQVMKRGHGISFGEYFIPDVDETAVGLAALYATDRAVDPEVLQQFQNGNHFQTFPHELNSSVFSNAHAIYALACAGQRKPETEKFLCERQCADGRWLADKWHNSWLYTTLEVLLALDPFDYTKEVLHAADVFLKNQNADGGWGSSGYSTRMETSYALIALNTIRQRGLLNGVVTTAVHQGHQWLQQQYTPLVPAPERLWLGKELYSPYRVDRIYEVSALLSVELVAERV